MNYTELLAKQNVKDTEELQKIVYRIGVNNNFEPLRDWFKALYEILLGESQGPRFGGFICNYPKSSRYVEYENLKKLLKINPKKSYYVAVLVKPNRKILEKIQNLPLVI